jgi:hypothetical protein
LDDVVSSSYTKVLDQITKLSKVSIIGKVSLSNNLFLFLQAYKQITGTGNENFDEGKNQLNEDTRENSAFSDKNHSKRRREV